MQVEPGGEWIFTMHGPDGKIYPDKTIFREVIRHKKLVHEHFEPNFIAIVEFEGQDDKTLLNCDILIDQIRVIVNRKSE